MFLVQRTFSPFGKQRRDFVWLYISRNWKDFYTIETK